MSIIENEKLYRKKISSVGISEFSETDPEFTDLFNDFAFGEAIARSALDDKTRFTAILATLIGCQGLDVFNSMLGAALDSDVTPIEIKEIVYQATAYMGIGRVYPFLNAVNNALIKRGVKLPLDSRSTVTAETRLEKGEQAQVDIFGEHMRGFARSGEPDVKHINKWLSENCFGDYYTRTGLDYRQREMITFCFLAAQGGCEPQLISHAKANIRIGNDKKFLIDVVSVCLPFIGYPRSLNALRCVNEAAKQ